MSWLNLFAGRANRQRRIELTLSHDGTRWIATGAGQRFAAPSLGALDDAICASLLGSRATIAEISFDMSTMPSWLHQYQSHYFNYRLRRAPASAGGAVTGT